MPFTDIILILVSLTALIFASIVDIRIKEVPDWLSYGLIASGLTIRLLHSIIFSDPLYLGYGLLGLGVTFLIGSLLYHLHQWGGGDAKLLMGLGTALATKPFFLPESSIPFFATLFIYILVAGAIYGIIWSITLILRNYTKFKNEFKSLLKTTKGHIIQTFSIIAAIFIIILVFFIDSITVKISLLAIGILLGSYFYLFAAVKSIENLNFYKEVPLYKLVEGDWLADDVKLRNQIIFKKRTTLEKKHIKKLKELNIKKVMIKEGIPFVPPFLIGTAIALLIGNPFF